MSLRFHIEFSSIPLWSQLYFTSVSLRSHIDFTSISLRYNTDLTSFPHRFPCDFTSVSLRIHFGLTSSPLRSTSISLRFLFNRILASLKTPVKRKPAGRLGTRGPISLRFHIDFPPITLRSPFEFTSVSFRSRCDSTSISLGSHFISISFWPPLKPPAKHRENESQLGVWGQGISGTTETKETLLTEFKGMLINTQQN